MFFCFNVSWDEVVSLRLDKNVFTVLYVLHFCRWKSVNRVRGLLEAAEVQILCLGLRARLLPVSHRMWGILSGSSKKGLQRQEEVVQGWREVGRTGGGGKQG